MRTPFLGRARTSCATLGTIAIVFSVFGSAPARADWPLSRADVQRTGVARGVGDLRAPAVFWRHYLGGTITSRGSLLADIDDDGRVEVLFVSGGKLVAKERDDSVVWETPVLALSTLVGISDLDGDGAREVAVRSNKQVLVVDMATGAERWRSPAGEFGFIDDVRMGDLSGDGLDDLFIQSCPCCRVSIGSPGATFSFARGFAASVAEQRMAILPSTSCGGRYSMAILDMNGDGRDEITYSDATGIGVLSGATGKPCLDGSACAPCINGTSGPDCQPNPAAVPLLDLGSRSNASHCLAMDSDADGSQELLCLQNNGPDTDPDLAHRLFALEYVAPGPNSPAHLEMRWRLTVGARPRLVGFGADPLADIDRDGSLEVAVSGVLDDGETWVSYVVDAASGTILAELPGEQIVGLLDLGDGSAKQLLTSAEGTLSSWSFERQATPRIASRWSLDERAAIVQTDLERIARSYVSGRVVMSDITNDGVPDLITRGTAPGGLLVVYDLSSGIPDRVASYTTDATVEILSAWSAPELPDENARVFMATSAGVMRALGVGLTPQTRGLRFGGYYPKGDWRNLEVTAVTAALDPGGDAVIVSDARGALVRIDARDASRYVPPRVVWSLPRTTAPGIVPGLDGDDPGIVCRQTLSDGSHRVQVVAADGQIVRSFDVGGQLLSDIVPANIDGDGVPDMYIQWGEPGVLDLHIQALSGATMDSILHLVPPFEGTTRFPAGGAVLDFDGDGRDDFVHQYYRTQVISGATGEIVAQTEPNGLYFMPIVAQLDADPEAELVLQGGFNPVRALDHDLTALWTSSADSRPYPYGSLVECPGAGPYLIEGSLAQPSTISRTNLDPGAAQNGEPADTWSRILAGGEDFATEADALAAGAFLGQLTSTAVHENLMGDGLPMALVGSEDGYLYAIDVCQGSLAFAVSLGASVGAIAFGDTDGDGTDEILVAAADGYLYALDNRAIDAPAWVLDTDPPRGIVDEDVDLLRTRSSMSALWQTVPGADGYEVAVVRAQSGEYMTSPPWQAVGNVDRTTVSGLELDYQEQYLFLVRALVDDQRSFDAASDGITVEYGYHVGCGCQGAGSGAAHGPLLVALIGWFWWRRQRARLRTTRP